MSEHEECATESRTGGFFRQLRVQVIFSSTLSTSSQTFQNHESEKREGTFSSFLSRLSNNQEAILMLATFHPPLNARLERNKLHLLACANQDDEGGRSKQRKG